MKRKSVGKRAATQKVETHITCKKPKPGKPIVYSQAALDLFDLIARILVEEDLKRTKQNSKKVL